MALSAAPDLIPPSALEWREKLYKEDSARCAPFPKMVSIPTGRFTMGALQERDGVEGGCLDSEKPAHEVYVPAFELSKYPITFAEYDYYFRLCWRWFGTRPSGRCGGDWCLYLFH